MSERDELRALIREVIRDQLADLGATDSMETVNLSTDEDLAEFVTRLLNMSPEERDELRSGRKRFRLSRPAPAPVQGGECAIAPPPGGTMAHSPRTTSAVRRIERGAVTERVVRDAARAGERLVLGRGAVLTPLARDRARSSGVQIERER
ncbi:MAG: hypothetical protein JO345_05385 [Streptosporangiaceae bacterium]|nr:hypothetical protein [Streptosporangiaceae bacterium]